ncbi:MAG: hypothetical protein ALECFALPRED_008558 [Alectoria fallacina]|uniref:Ribosomal protein S6 n=1 Tax=Alectoria fallacina TaxID=1903189 RepID=A0A8H3HVT0_9LECA|nr:MAG: hypothetical protein ALECFALPRED_008558 [Alectoria fallacina]
MLYEMIAVVRVGKPHTTNEVKEIARTACDLILARGGVVRGLTNWGPFLLIKPIKKNQIRHDSGHHFILRFDASPSLQELVRKTVAIDPRMVRCGVVKMGGRLKDIVDAKGVVEWQRKRRERNLGSYMNSVLQA